MQIKMLTQDLESQYETFLLEFPQSLLYYNLQYRNFLLDLLHAESEYMVAQDNGNITGVLPLMKKEGKFGHVYNSLPFYGSNGGILAKNADAFKSLLSHYQSKISNPDIASATLISHPFVEGDYSSLKATHFDRRIAQFTPIDQAKTVEQLLQQVESSTRRNIRKAQKNGVEVTVDNTKIEFLKRTHQDNMAAIGGKAKTERFFSLIEKHFTPNRDYKIWVASLNGEPIGALLLFYYNRTVEYFTPAIVEKYRTYQALPLIICQAMTEASKRDFAWWNWGGTWLTQEGVYRFKKKWGTEEKHYVYHIHLNNQAIVQSTKTELLEQYPDFFVIPFDQLKGG